jgi:ribokinase
MPEILIIGGVTLDRLHFGGRSAEMPGGAGLYTALAAARAGAEVTLFAQRPALLPAALQPIDQIIRWIGPLIRMEELPRLEIVHHGGGRAELKRADWGAQPSLSVAMLPAQISSYQIVHIAALGPSRKQLEFLDFLRAETRARLSAGTYGMAAHGETDLVRRLLSKSDLFFMNENECRALYGAPEKVPAGSGQKIFVTMGAYGAWGITPKQRLHIPAKTADELDPTGAGDTFCGAVLAVLLQGAGLTTAMERGVQLAAAVVQGVGPEKLMAGASGFNALE